MLPLLWSQAGRGLLDPGAQGRGDLHSPGVWGSSVETLARAALQFPSLVRLWARTLQVPGSSTVPPHHAWEPLRVGGRHGVQQPGHGSAPVRAVLRRLCRGPASSAQGH